MLEDYTPLTDMRASASYRMRVAQNLLLRFFLEQTTEDYPVRLGIKYVPAHIEENDTRASGND
jgi:xanthine dehydrogenase iron-sulfur cluster and FAD-binding subunit A